MGWEGDTSAIRAEIEKQREAARGAYEADPKLVEEHAGQERERSPGDTAAGKCTNSSRTLRTN